MTVRQRSTTSIPGSVERLSLAIGDITGGQVVVELARGEGGALLGPLSMKPGDSAPFLYEDVKYALELMRLRNKLVGEDFATFRLTHSSSSASTEAQKIDALIECVRSSTGAVFVRNGTEHSPAEAAQHLRQKLAAAGAEIGTAGEFIERIASRSSITGEEYRLRFADGRSVPVAEFLQAELAKLPSGH